MPACEPQPDRVVATEMFDATELPYHSFTMIISQTNLLSCDNELENKSVGHCELEDDTHIASGFFLAKSMVWNNRMFVATAAHLCDHKDWMPGPEENKIKISHEFEAYDYDGNRYQAEFVQSSTVTDVCILVIDGVDKEVTTVVISQQSPIQGERVYNIAAPGGIFSPQMVLTFEGFYSGIYAGDMAFTIPATGGSSGSMVLNSRGQLISMLSWVPRKVITDSKGGKHKAQIVSAISFGVQASLVNSILEQAMTKDLEILPTLLKKD